MLMTPIKPKIDAVVILTETGFTATAVSRYRLTIPIIALTDNKATAESLTVAFGVTPIIAEFPTGVFTSADHIIADLKKKDIVHADDTLLLVHGHHWQKPGNTNALAIVTA